MFRTLVVVCFLACSNISVAIEGDDNTAYIPLYRGADVVERETNTAIDWELPLAKYRKVNGVWQFSDKKLLHGNLQRTTYLIKTQNLFKNIATFYDTWANSKTSKVLFSCKNRSCGSSNEWANGYFKRSRLYGVEGKQRYWALKKGTDYLAVYLIERGNRQKYLQVDVLTPLNAQE